MAVADESTLAPVAPEDELDLVALLPASWRTRLRAFAARWRPVDSAALAVILAQLVVVAPVVWSGSFYIDDFRAQSYATGQPFWPWIVQSNGTHFAPGARTLDWLQTQFLPLQHGWAVVVTLAVRLLLGVALWALLRRLTGPRPATVVALGILLMTASLLPATAWYRQSITALPSAIAVLVATESLVRHVRRPRWSTLAQTVGAMAVGLCFLEKTAVLVPWIAGLGLFLLPSLLGLPWRTVVRRTALPFVACSALLAGFLAFYLGSGSFDKGSGSQLHPGDIITMVTLNLTKGLAPAMVGGPWQWAYPSPYLGVGDPPPWLVVASAVAVLACVLWGLTRSVRRTVGALAAFAFFYLPGAAMVAVGRLSRFGTDVGLQLRLWDDAILVLGVVLAVVILGPARRRSAGVPRKARVGAAPAVDPSEPGDVLPVDRPRRRSARAELPAVGALLVLVLVMVNVGHSTVLFAQGWASNPAGAYLDRLRSDLAKAGTTPTLASVAALPVVPLIDPDYNVEELLAPLRTTAVFHEDVAGTLVARDDGSLGPARWTTISHVVMPRGWCGVNIKAGSGPRTLVMNRVGPYYRDAQVRLAVLSSGTTGLDVSVVTSDGTKPTITRTPVTVDHGAYRLIWRVPYGARVTAVTVQATDPSVTLCIPAASIASPTATAPEAPLESQDPAATGAGS